MLVKFIYGISFVFGPLTTLRLRVQLSRGGESREDTSVRQLLTRKRKRITRQEFKGCCGIKEKLSCNKSLNKVQRHLKINKRHRNMFQPISRSLTNFINQNYAKVHILTGTIASHWCNRNRESWAGKLNVFTQNRSPLQRSEGEQGFVQIHRKQFSPPVKFNLDFCCVQLIPF